MPTARPPAGAPNVVLIVLDDVGFAQLGSFGSNIATPALDSLAVSGLRYNRFHVTALCSPTRASLLTGRNHHRVGMGFLADFETTDLGYTSRIPESAASVARVLRDAGYNTMAVGKWHLTPRADRSASGPFDTWPTGQGFERFYGFINGDSNQWTPTLASDNHVIEQARGPEDGYHLSDDLADVAIGMITDKHNAVRAKPFFLYFALGAAHAPHQAPPDWIERERGRFDAGWDVLRQENFERQLAMGIVPPGTELTPRPSWVPAWDDVPAEEQRLYARQQEAFAAFMSHADQAIGRVVAHLEHLGIADDTLVLACSDNGASAEGGTIGSINEHRFAFRHGDNLADNLASIDEIGGFRAYNHHAWGWAWAGNTPFRLWKRYTWLGGTRTPLIVRWPGGIAAGSNGSIRKPLCHAIDVAPTILAAAGVPWPERVGGVEQMPVDGAPLQPTFDDADAPDPRTTQYFEMVGSRSIYHAGWKATTNHVSQGVPDEERLIEGSRSFEDDHWALFSMHDDFSEARDVADRHPDVVAELEQLWWAEAESNHVLPMYDGLMARAAAMIPPSWPVPPEVEIRPGGAPIADEALPPMGVFATRVRVELDAPGDGGSGVLVAQGDWNNGWTIVVHDGVVHGHLSVVGWELELVGAQPWTAGHHTVTLDFNVSERPQPPALAGETGAVLTVDGEVVATATGPGFHNTAQIGGAFLTVGRDRGFPVAGSYTPPFPWTGTIDKVVLTAPGPADERDQAVLHEALRRD